MTPAEFADLSLSSKVVRVGYRVTNLGVTASFETGNTISSTASTHFYVDGINAKGINNLIPIKTYKPVLTAGKVTQSSQGNCEAADFEIWNHASATRRTATIMEVDNPWYVDMATLDIEINTGTNFDTYNNSVHGYPCLDKILTKFDANATKGEVIISDTYVPKDGTICKPLLAHNAYRNNTTNQYALGKSNNLFYSLVTNNAQTSNSTQQNGFIPHETQNTSTNGNNNGYDGVYVGFRQLTYSERVSHRNQPIEKINYRGDILDDTHKTQPAQAAACFGIMPVFANAPSSGNADPINTCMNVRIETFVEIMEPKDYFLYDTARRHPYNDTYARADFNSQNYINADGRYLGALDIYNNAQYGLVNSFINIRENNAKAIDFVQSTTVRHNYDLRNKAAKKGQTGTGKKS